MRNSFVLSILLQLASGRWASADDTQIIPSLAIVGGSIAKKGAYPYYVQVDTSTSIDASSKDHSCGATLIAPDLVWMAAHCEDRTGYELKIGAYNQKSYNGGAQKRVCEEWRAHPDFVPAGSQQPDKSDLLDYDYALCKLDEPVFIDTSQVRLVLNEDPLVPADGQMVTAMGHGLYRGVQPGSFPNGPTSTRLREMEVPVVGDDTCITAGINDLKACFGIIADPKQLICNGDSGAPVIMKGEDGVHIMLGHVSYGSGSCGFKESVMARTSAGIGWVRETACGDSGLGSEFFCTESPSVSPTISPTTISPTTKSDKKMKSSKRSKKKSRKSDKSRRIIL